MLWATLVLLKADQRRYALTDDRCLAAQLLAADAPLALAACLQVPSLAEGATAILEIIAKRKAVAKPLASDDDKTDPADAKSAELAKVATTPQIVTSASTSGETARNSLDSTEQSQNGGDAITKMAVAETATAPRELVRAPN